MDDDETGRGRADRRGLVSWALFDWANSPFSTLIITFVFPAYFGMAVVGDEARGQSLWGYALGVSGLMIAVLAPLLGAVADAAGRRKPWLLGFTALCVAGTAMLWFVRPVPEAVAWAVVWVIVANFGFEFANVFYNAMLPDIVDDKRIGRWSGWAWGIGYLGGLSALAVALLGFIQAEEPWFGLDKETAEHVRVIGPLVALWFVAFAWPVFAYTPEAGPSAAPSWATVRKTLGLLRQTVGEFRGFGNVPRFLLAHLLYADGLATVFAFGGIFAAGVFGMELPEIIAFGILLNVTAGLGAFAFGWIDDWIGGRRTVLIALTGIVLSTLGVLVTEDRLWFWIFGAVLGIFVGPAQAAGRSLMARLSPPERGTEYFGLYALSGKATAFSGPLLVGWVTGIADDQRAGLSVVLAFFIGAIAILWFVKEPGRG